MKKRFLVLMSMVAVFSVLSLVSSLPAYADSYDLILATDGGEGGCNSDVSISVQPIAPDVYTMRATGSANCNGAGQTTVAVCVLMQQANGDYEQTGGACGAGSSSGRASASAEVVCAAGTKYRATIVAEQGNTIGKNRSAPVTCPPL
jgi:hypothetical protein